MGNTGSGNGGGGGGNNANIGRVVSKVMKPTDTHCAPGEECIDKKYCSPNYGYDPNTKTCNPAPSSSHSNYSGYGGSGTGSESSRRNTRK